MFKWLATCLLLLASISANAEVDIQKDTLYPQVELDTSMGKIVVELDRTRAPLTVDNFLTYVVKGEYDNTIFHRVIAEFVVQGGGLTPKLEERPSLKPVVNESGNGLSNALGTIAMARDNDPHSATRQFYFNMGDNKKLDPSKRRWGYTVFGEVTKGMDVLEAISLMPTEHNSTLNWPDFPVKTVILKKATLLPR
ncbi:peptidyl-prolyl cis-trans isomerase [Shewanella sp. SR43-4]|uniref:peptidylprolyl isomerase n=1 Tax=Shewanella TaxID=22 RepID=UPI000C4A3181|nr:MULTISPECIES: peptidylprolyl isomerase [Shewanella]NCQ46697.1 peptidyl-prolyl cis-trans isomerase [Shewanella frigidimarina]MBB1319241.1 peptidyl-prolyl cis-trans isomerase [Shewanella sp. SR43-4]MBB1321159.1 peptidyl-prolyl cis-trans isomerase [Shewanella sp. SR43-8]MBB1390836.1 peptidyl-prolyl cis-trans isomerase [Shewanella sp. SG44-6]MBB1474081.1 peptidyl-prolyl cis-trans isomerase [Shewanella sp. SG41-3]